MFYLPVNLGVYPDSRRVRIWRAPGTRNRIQHVQDVHSYRGGTMTVREKLSLGPTEVVLDRFLISRKLR